MTLWFLLGALALAGPPPNRAAAIAKVEAAVEHHRKRELDAAEAALIDAIMLDEDVHEARLSLGRLFLQRKQFGNARGMFIAALDRPGLDPAMRVELLYGRGRAHAGLGDDDELPVATRREELRDAELTFAEVIRADPRHFRAHYRRGLALQELDDPEHADAAFRACIAIEPRYTQCWISLAHMNIDYGFLNVGLRVLEQGLGVNADDAALWNALGRAEMVRENTALAVEAFEKAAKLDPELVDALFGLGRAYAELGRSAEAVDRLQAFLARAGNDVPSHLKRAANDMIVRLQDAP